MSRKRDYFFKAWALFLVVMLGLITLFFLPKEIFGWSPKPIDMLGDLRVEGFYDESRVVDSIPSGANDKKNLPSAKNKNLSSKERARQAKRRRAYESIIASVDSTTLQTSISDYSEERTGLKRFFGRVGKIRKMDRPVHIAVLGDSFIEGDILTDAIRSALQQRWGGSGVGWLPMSSETAGFRQSIRHEFSAWQDKSLLHAKGERHLITGHVFRPKSKGAWSKYTLPKSNKPFNRATLYYRSSQDIPIRITVQDSTETVILPSSEDELRGYLIASGREMNSIRIDFDKESLFDCYGLSLEAATGVSVDNMSLRGNSGLLLAKADEELNKAFNTERPYDLIILQYGLNVANAGQKDYSNYTKQMKKAIVHLQELYPNADVMLFGVSDRAKRSSGSFSTMPAIVKLHQQQELLAQELGITFWSPLNTMKSLGGITEMARKGQAAKDYTHLSHKGGQKIAEKFVEALILEEKYYNAIKN